MDDQSDIAYCMPFLEHAASQSQVIIEIGCGHGNGSTRALARGIARSPATSKLFLSVDIDPARPEEAPDLPYWYGVYGPSEDPDTADMADYFLRGRYASLIYIDTDHTYQQLKAEHEVWGRFADDRTTWLYHDTWMYGSYNPMTDAAKQFAKHYGLLYEDVTKLSHGLGMVSLDGHPDWPGLE
jgi:cephalosporin hydroxylase